MVVIMAKAKTYNTVSGDTFDGIAHRILGNRRYTRELMEVNPKYISTVIFSAGITLVIPDITTTANQINLPPWRVE
jgi:phage tail protein X